LDHQSSEKNGSQSQADRLPSRDWLVLPLLSMMTVGMMFILAEVSTRLLWKEGGVDSCRVSDPIVAWRYKPYCTERMKSPESPWIDYKFNECGYRAASSCEAKPADGLRVALLGSSTSLGLMVPYEDSFAALTGDILSRQCGRPFEFQNLGAVGSEPIYAYQRVDEALALKPDAVMLAVAPFDIQQDIDPQLLAARKNPLPLRDYRSKGENASIIAHIEDWLSASRSVIVARHFLYENQQEYLKLFLLQGDSADFLRVPFSSAWERRLSNLDLLLGEMADKVHHAGIPFVLTVIPARAQAALLNLHDLPPGVDPYALDRRFAEIAEKHGIIFVDSFNDFSHVLNAEALFYPADGHLAPAGHALLSGVIARRLTGGGVPGFPTCRSAKPES
jgi:hypothetical protein